MLSQWGGGRRRPTALPNISERRDRSWTQLLSVYRRRQQIFQDRLLVYGLNWIKLGEDEKRNIAPFDL